MTEEREKAPAHLVGAEIKCKCGKSLMRELYLTETEVAAGVVDVVGAAKVLVAGDVARKFAEEHFHEGTAQGVIVVYRRKTEI